MRSIRTDRLWLAGGAVTAVVLLAVSWFFFIGPQRAETGRLNDQASIAELQLTTLQRRLVELRDQNTRLPQFQAQLVRDRQALPTSAALADYLRQLQVGGDLTGVTVNSMLVGAPAAASAAGRRVYALPITLIATGNAAQLRLFIDQVQQVQPRAVLINTANAAPVEGALSLGGRIDLTLGVQVFVASLDDTDGAVATKPN